MADIAIIKSKLAIKPTEDLKRTKNLLIKELDELNESIKNITKIGRDQSHYEDMVVDSYRKGG